MTERVSIFSRKGAKKVGSLASRPLGKGLKGLQETRKVARKAGLRPRRPKRSRVRKELQKRSRKGKQEELLQEGIRIPELDEDEGLSLDESSESDERSILNPLGD